MKLHINNSRTSSAIIALFVVFLWATSWVFVKIGLQEIPALTFAGLRYTLAFIFLLPVVFMIKSGSSLRSITKRSLSQLLFLGLLLYTVTQGAIFVALDYMPAVSVNLLWSFSSVTVAILGIRFLNERPTLFQWVGVILAIFGAVIFFYPAAFPRNYQVGIIVSAIGILANAGASILGRDINRSGKLHPLIVTVVSMGIGSIVLLTSGIIVQGLPSIGLHGWAIIAWLAIVNTAIAFTLWNFTLRNLSATESSVINGTMMIWIPILAVVFLDEHITHQELIGMIVAGIGTFIVQLRHPSALYRLLGRRSILRN
ncbi:MAG: EamA family transporter [Anaerolineales bacterium]|nr:EamA family transporter [Anaerolineales bacterium]